MLQRIGRLLASRRGKARRLDDEEIGFVPQKKQDLHGQTAHSADYFRSPVWQETMQIWMKTLPINKRPVTLAAQHPRIAAAIMMHWEEHLALENYLQTLLFDKREHRQGFSKPVGAELLSLQSYVAKRARIKALAATAANENDEKAATTSLTQASIVKPAQESADLWYRTRGTTSRFAIDSRVLL